MSMHLVAAPSMGTYRVQHLTQSCDGIHHLVLGRWGHVFYIEPQSTQQSVSGSLLSVPHLDLYHLGEDWLPSVFVLYPYCYKTIRVCSIHNIGGTAETPGEATNQGVCAGDHHQCRSPL